MSSPFECNPKRCNPQLSPRTAMSGKATRRTRHTGPNIVKKSTMEEGDDEGEQRAVTGSLAFQGNRQGHGCHRAPWQSRTSRSGPWNRLLPPRRAIAAQWLRSTSHCMPAESISPRANAGAASLTNRRIRSRSSTFLFLHVAESCFSRASTASLPETSSVTVTRTAGAEVSTLPIATTGSVALGSVVTSWPTWATIIAR